MNSTCMFGRADNLSALLVGGRGQQELSAAPLQLCLSRIIGDKTSCRSKVPRLGPQPNIWLLAGVRAIVIAGGRLQGYCASRERAWRCYRDFSAKFHCMKCLTSSAELAPVRFRLRFITGGLTSLTIFGLKWDVGRCSRVFKALLQRWFRRSHCVTWHFHSSSV